MATLHDRTLFLIGSGPSLAAGTIRVIEAPSLVVTTAEDVVSENDGQTSLREAIAYAATLDGPQTITFSDNTVGGAVNFHDGNSRTITLGGTQLTVSSDLTIEGPGADLLTISANQQSRVFQFTATSTSTLSGLTISHGQTSTDGAGIHNNFGNVTINHCVISGNSTTTNGGGIMNTRGQLTISNSTISGNSAFLGAGIFSNSVNGTPADPAGTIIRNSTISGNSATTAGGGIRNSNGVTEITHSTITANTAGDQGGGVWSWNDSLTATRIGQSIVSGNSSHDLASNLTVTPFISLGHNLIGSAGNNVNFSQEFIATGDLTGITNPQLGPLTNNGGTTPTHALSASSPAIFASIFVEGVTTDQRGFPRRQDLAPDIGAVEFDFPSLVVTSTGDGIDVSDGQTSLREAISNAAILSSILPDPQTITFSNTDANGAVNFYDGDSRTITLNGTQLTVASDVTIEGPGADLLTISGNGQSRVFEFTAGTTGMLYGMTIAEGNTSGGGAGVFNNQANLLISHCVIAENSTTANGGGVMNFRGQLTISQSTLAENTASFGGGIFSNTVNGTSASPAATIIRNSTISGNTATGSQGGGIRNFNGVTEITHSTISANTAPFGGGIRSYNDGFTATRIGQSIIAGNNGDDLSANATTQRFSSLGYNLIGVGGENVNALLDFIETGDLTGISDPRLGPLAHNGGPTPTHELLEDSPAINASAEVEGVPTDQRGVTRPQGTAPDIGAFERGGNSQTITFAEIDPQFITATVTLEATATSGLPVSFSVTAGPGVITGGTILSFLGDGPVEITATQEGDLLWTAANPVVRIVQVNKLLAVVNLHNLVHVFDKFNKTATVTTDPDGLTVVTTYDGSPFAPAAVGTYTVVATVIDDLYEGSATDTLEILPPPNLHAPVIVNLDGDEVSGTPGSLLRIDEGEDVLVIDADEYPVTGGSLIITPTSSLTGTFSADGTVVLIEGDVGFGVGVGQTVTVSGIPIGVVAQNGSSAPLEIALNENASPERLTDILQELFFHSSELGAHTFTAMINDGTFDSNVAQFTVIIDSLLEVVVSEAPIFNPETGLFESIVTVTNPHQVPVSGFILRVDNLPSDVSVSNAQGMNNGLPAMAFTQTLQSGESVLVLVEFFRASGDPDFNPVYEAEFILPAETDLPFAITRITRLPNGEIELEWPTLPGQIYAIEYSPDLVNWTRVQPPITAVNELFQWTDPGTPQTNPHPSTIGSRFYRVLRLTP